MLIKSLDASKDILCAGEIFHNGPNIYHREYQFPHSLAKKSPFVRVWNALRTRGRTKSHLRWFYDNAGMGVTAVGFKLMTSQTKTFPWLMRMLRDCDVTPLYLLRRDVLATAISYYKAKATGRFHSDRPEGGRGSGVLTIDDNEFRRVLGLCRENKRQLESLHAVNGGLLLAYEDMISDWQGFIAVIGRTIGVPDLQVEMAISRLKPGIDSAQLVVDEAILRKRFGAFAAG